MALTQSACAAQLVVNAPSPRLTTRDSGCLAVNHELIVNRLSEDRGGTGHTRGSKTDVQPE